MSLPCVHETVTDELVNLKAGLKFRSFLILNTVFPKGIVLGCNGNDEAWGPEGEEEVKQSLLSPSPVLLLQPLLCNTME